WQRCAHRVERNRARYKLSRVQGDGLIRNRTGSDVLPGNPSFIVTVDRNPTSDYEIVSSSQLVQESIVKIWIPCKAKVWRGLLVVAAIARRAQLQHGIEVAIQHARLKEAGRRAEKIA